MPSISQPVAHFACQMLLRVRGFNSCTVRVHRITTGSEDYVGLVCHVLSYGNRCTRNLVAGNLLVLVLVLVQVQGTVTCSVPVVPVVLVPLSHCWGQGTGGRQDKHTCTRSNTDAYT
jgi:hypothetical protein